MALARSKILWVGLMAAALVAAGFFWWNAGDEGGGLRADPTDARQVALGARVYGAQCAACHGARLEGQPNWRRRLPDGRLPAPPHDAGGHTWHHPDQLLFDVTKKGGQAAAPPGFVSGMPGFGGRLTDHEIWAVIAYIKGTWPPAVRARQAMIDRQHRQAKPR